MQIIKKYDVGHCFIKKRLYICSIKTSLNNTVSQKPKKIRRASVIEMTTIKSIKEKTRFLDWYLGYGILELAESRFLSANETKELINREFSEVENLENELEAYNDTYAFRKECVMLDHDFADASGSNYDLMLVEYRGKKYEINDRRNTVTRYENTFGC